MYPYPATHFCEVPFESDAIHERMCRPLPVEHFPRDVPKRIEPTPLRLAPPGSLTYTHEKSLPPNAWARGSTSIKVAGKSASKSATPPGLVATPSGESSLVRFKMHSSVLAFFAGTRSSPAIHTPAPTVPHISRLNTDTASSSELSYATPVWVPTPALSPDSSGRDSSDGENRVTPSTPDGASIESLMSGLSVSNDVSGEEEEDIDDLWNVPMNATTSVYTDFTTTEEVTENLWADYGQETVQAAADPDEIICTEHGKLCKRGICSQYKKQKRDHERRKQEAERSAYMSAKSKQNSGNHWVTGDGKPKLSCC